MNLPTADLQTPAIQQEVLVPDGKAVGHLARGRCGPDTGTADNCHTNEGPA
jgi:hypothetical protein